MGRCSKNVVSGFVLATGVLVAIVTLVYAAMRGPRVAGNPFNAASLEWQCSSPPDFHNFVHNPVVSDAYDFEGMVYDPELDTYVRRDFMEPSERPAEQPSPQHH